MTTPTTTTILLLLLFTLLSSTTASSSSSSSMAFEYHKGPLLRGPITLNLHWYGPFTPPQRAIITDFLTSLSSPHPPPTPSVSAWWSSVAKYYRLATPHPTPSPLTLSVSHQTLDSSYSLGKSLTSQHLQILAHKSTTPGLTLILTSSDVTVEGFCMSRCGTHGSIRSGPRARRPYIWVGNSEKQCPGQCAWPFHQPIYGPQGPPLISPNNDVGVDGMVINIASLLAGTATNPYGSGFYQGPKEAPLEAASACPGVYGKGAYPGYAGQLLVDPRSGASYNANGVNGRRYLLPGLYDPATSTCSTLV